LTAALEIFTELGAALWVARARDELSRISGSAPASEAGLTATERRIARLAASGRSNKQVAAELVIPVRTVESNLTRVYRKLHLGIRAEPRPGRAPSACRDVLRRARPDVPAASLQRAARVRAVARPRRVHPRRTGDALDHDCTAPPRPRRGVDRLRGRARVHR